jgi:transcriptional regulator with XRE-family HTH domain
MSCFGKNIKKIRVAKNISQTAFADLFKLTRASIGAYEEGRAEARIDTIIEIADYFQLTLDHLLKNELTVNDIYHIAAITQKIESNKTNWQAEIEIPFIKISDLDLFKKNYGDPEYLRGLQNIKMPGLIKNSMAFEFSELMEPTMYSGLRIGDLVVAQRIVFNKIDPIVKNQLYVVLTAKELFLSRIDSNLSNNLIFETKGLNISDDSIKAMWTVYQIISSKIPLADQVEMRLQNIESQLNKLLNK